MSTEYGSQSPASKPSDSGEEEFMRLSRLPRSAQAHIAKARLTTLTSSGRITVVRGPKDLEGSGSGT